MATAEPSMAAAVVVVGSLNVDLIVRVPRLPTPGETVSGGTFGRAFGGKGANAAAAAARLGAQTWIVGMVGDDDLGDATRSDLGERGVHVEHLRTGRGPTGVAEILVDDHGENLIAVAPGANAELGGSDVRSALAAVPVKDAVVVANLEIGDEAVMAAAAATHGRRSRFVLNPAPARALPEELLSMVDVLTPNQHEMTALGRGSVREFLDAGVGAVVVTRGAAGADLYRPGIPPHHQEAFAIRAVDSTGAGDAFTAALAWALSDGRTLEDAVRLAAAAGALACREVGARESLPDRAELERFVSGPSRAANQPQAAFD